MVWLFKLKLKRFLILLVLTGLILPIAIIPLRLMVTIVRVPQPQAIFVLGGNEQRIFYAAQLAQKRPNLDIWISDYPYLYDYHKSILQQAGIAPERMYYDACATDTVTNFTCTVKDFIERDIARVYLVTSDYHMRRAIIIATLVFGSRGIAIAPISVPSSQQQSESLWRGVRDGIRSLIWIFTGRTGASFNPRLQSIKQA
jgi:uncharacterized SAM-binding protein YcdF (DUF218 family)